MRTWSISTILLRKEDPEKLKISINLQSIVRKMLKSDTNWCTKNSADKRAEINLVA